MPASRLHAAMLAVALLRGSEATATQIITTSEVGDFVGGAVTVEGDVVGARVENGGLLLELAPPGPKAFHVVLVLALISDLPRQPERLYAGRRIRATGIIQRFQGRSEMVVESTSQIEVVDVAGVDASVTTTVTTTTLPAPAAAVRPPSVPAAPVATAPPSPAPAIAVPPAAAPAAVVSPPAVASPPVVASPPASAPATATTLPSAPERPLLSERIAAEMCERAHTRWRDAADDVRAKSAALARCLDATTYRCREVAAALAPALTELEWAEQQVGARCD